MKLLLFGDSNTAGLAHALTGENPSQPTGLLAPNTVVVNEARGGESSAQALARVGEVVKRGPFTAAVVCYGGVDVLGEVVSNGPSGSGVVAAINNMVAIEAALKAGGTSRVFLAEGVGCRLSGATLDFPVAKLKQLRAGYYQIGYCLRKRGHALSFAMPQDPALFSAADAIHLSMLGYEVLAQRVAAFLRIAGVAC